MEQIDNIYGFPVIQNEKDGTVEIKSDCDYPQQSQECESLYHGIERQFIEIEKLKYPLNIKEWKVIIEPTEENIKNYFSPEGIMNYLEEIKPRLTDTKTFFKIEVSYSKEKELPNIILHFYRVNHEDKLNIRNTDSFSYRCFIEYNIKQLTPERITSLKENNINHKWIKNIPLFPVEMIKFDLDNNIKNFKHQELNKEYFQELW